MAKLTAAQALTRLPHKQYLSLREVWKDLKLFSSVLTAAAPAAKIKKLKMVPDALDDMTLEDLKKAKIKNPKNVQNVVTKPIGPPRKAAIPIKDNKALVTKNVKQLPVKAPAQDKQVSELDKLAPVFNGPISDVSNKFTGLDSIPIAPEDKEQFDKVNVQLGVLMHQREIINNIVNSLKGGFANIGDDSADNIAKATAYSEKIAKTVTTNITNLRNVMHNSAKALVPQSFNNLVNNIYNDVKTRLNSSTTHKINIMYACGTGVKGGFQLTAFLIFKNITTEQGTTPQYVVAISLSGTDYWINPSMTRVPTFNKFSLGYKIPHNKNDNPNGAIAKLYINEQFALIDNYDVRKVPVPPHLEGMDLQNIKNVDSVNFTNDSIEVTFKSNIVSMLQAQEATNNLFIIFTNAMYIYEHKQQIKIRPKIGQTGTKWFAIFIFSKGNAISGRTLHRDEVDYLSKIFHQEDINKIKFVLSSETTKLKQKAA